MSRNLGTLLGGLILTLIHIITWPNNPIRVFNNYIDSLTFLESFRYVLDLFNEKETHFLQMKKIIIILFYKYKDQNYIYEDQT